MTEAYLKDQIDYVQARIEEIDGKLLNGAPSEKGYKEVIDSYNKWIDRYDEMITRLEHIDDVDIEEQKLQVEREKMQSMAKIEQDKLEFEKEKLKLMNEIEHDKLNIESERNRLDREKFAHDVEAQKVENIKNIIFDTGELTVRAGIPMLAIAATMGVAKLSYMNEADFKLCNGRVYGGIKDLIRILTSNV